MSESVSPEVAALATELAPEQPLVGIVMGSQSDMDLMHAASRELNARGIANELHVMSAHRDPEVVSDYARNARSRGLRVIIAGAGLSAALPGVVAAHTDLPVIGVPLSSRLSAAGGLDAILSVVQMPPGVPVAAVGLDNPKNAAVLAARILGAQDPAAAVERATNRSGLKPLAAQFKRRLSASARRERIVAAALELFAQRGYEGVAMADIAAAADVTRSVLYDHFPAKRDLFLQLLSEQAAALLSDVAGRIVAAGTPRERMRSTVDAFFASVAAHPFAWRMVVRESTGDAEVAAAHRKLGSEHTAAVRAMLAADMRKGGIDPDSARAEAGVELVITAILGLALWWHERPEVARETLVDAVMDVLWVGLERSAGLT